MSPLAVSFRTGQKKTQTPGPGKGMLGRGLLASPCPQAVRLVAVPGGRVARR